MVWHLEGQQEQEKEELLVWHQLQALADQLLGLQPGEWRQEEQQEESSFLQAEPEARLGHKLHKRGQYSLGW